MSPATRQVLPGPTPTLRDRLEVALARLPPAQLQALRLLRAGGRSYEEIAATMGVSLDEMRRLLWRARERLRQELFAHVTEAPT
jgi:RNA polymerase sigma factor (sigma-70 family)